MKLSRLITYTFDQNVGSMDRLFRIITGLAIATFAVSGVVAVPTWLTIILTVVGLAWLMTGVVSRCGMYYMLGMSTRKTS